MTINIPTTSLGPKICGIVTLIGTSIVQFFPEYTKYGLFLSSVATGIGLMTARQNGVTSEQVQAAKAGLPIPETPKAGAEPKP